MPKRKRTFSSAEKREKARLRAEFMTIFVNGKQKRVPRPTLIDGLPVDEFIQRNADPIWLHQNGLWEDMVDTAEDDVAPGYVGRSPGPAPPKHTDDDDSPF